MVVSGGEGILFERCEDMKRRGRTGLGAEGILRQDASEV
jgi:hypothetical protein